MLNIDIGQTCPPLIVQKWFQDVEKNEGQGHLYIVQTIKDFKEKASLSKFVK